MCRCAWKTWRGLTVVVVVRDTLIGLGRFELQSYEKVGIEVEPGRAEHTAHCFVMSRTIKGISMQSSLKLLENEATSQPEFSPTIGIHLLHPSLPLSLGERRAKAEQSEMRIHTRTTSHVPLIPSFPHFPRKNVLDTTQI